MKLLDTKKWREVLMNCCKTRIDGGKDTVLSLRDGVPQEESLENHIDKMIEICEKRCGVENIEFFEIWQRIA